MKKLCAKGKLCKTSPNEAIPIERFSTHVSGRVKAICNRCHNGAVSKIDTYSEMQKFMTVRLWNKSSSAAINVYCSEPEMVL